VESDAHHARREPQPEQRLVPEDIGRCRRGVVKNNKLSEYDYLAECKGQAFEALEDTGHPGLQAR